MIIITIRFRTAGVLSGRCHHESTSSRIALVLTLCRSRAGPKIRRAPTAFELATLVRPGFRRRQTRKPLRPARSRSRLVPLVSRHGRQHLQRSRRNQTSSKPLHRGQSRSGFAPRSLHPLRGFRLARHHRLRRERPRNRQASGLSRSRRNGLHAPGHHRRSLARPLRPGRAQAYHPRERHPHSADYFALDDAHRRAQGIPRVDKHIYARENGWAINALVALYASAGDAAVLDDALRATRWTIANRSLPGGGFRHGTTDANGPYLGDNIAMQRAFLALYGATADRQWLTRAEAAMKFIDANFKDPQGAGYNSSKSATDRAASPHPQRDENIDVVRAANFLFHITANDADKKIAERAMRYVAADPIVFRLPAAGPLLADYELSSEPLHLTIVGPRKTPSRKIFSTRPSATPPATSASNGGIPARAPRVAFPTRTSSIPA